MKLASVFTSHMVLQRDKSVPVWGWADPGDTVTVEFAGQQKSSAVADDGAWSVALDALPASAEPRRLIASAAKAGGRVVLDDVLVGEVWLASGQSNMGWKVSDSNNAREETVTADHPLLRLFTVPQRTLDNPPPCFEGRWTLCSPDTVGSFSAAAYFFGRELLQELKVPVGLIHSSWGGTRIETWIQREMLVTDPTGLRVVKEYEDGLNDDAQQAESELRQKDPIAWEQSRVPADPGNGGFAKGWAGVDFDDSGWDTMVLPTKWQAQGHGYCGVFWFRRDVEVPAEWVGKDLQLGLGACDKHDTTYFNGVEVGSIGWETPDAWCTPRIYMIPADLVRPGRNVVTTRVYSYLNDGGLIGPADAMRLVPADAADTDDGLSLTGAWRYQVAHNFGVVAVPQTPMGPGNPNTPCMLFENMIRPLAPLAMRGAIWYQGESNTGDAASYARLFPLMIRDWRETFAQPDLAVHFVQLANYTKRSTEPIQEGWAALRESQSQALAVPNTGMAVAIDIGEGDDIHPRNKQDVGRRLAYGALAQVYEQDVTPSGPIYRSHRVEGDAIRIEFDYADGLTTSDGAPPKAFAIAASDGKFEFADATIDGESVVVHSEAVPKPSAVRYAWANNPEVNVCNAAGLPASPFRTDAR